jgi:uncharacterized protein YlxP (DUF503 family)
MIIGVLKIQIHLFGIGSLKGKRQIIKSVIGRLKSRFNFSVSEIDAHDSKVLGVIGLAVTGNDGHFINQQMDKVINFIQNDGRFYVGSIYRELFYTNDD